MTSNPPYDFLYLFSEAPAIGGVYGIHTGIRNDINGLGKTIFDNSADYGSSSKLQSLIALNFASSGPILHETMHRWGVSFPSSLGFSSGSASHWGMSGTDGQLGGFDPATLTKVNDTTYTVKSFGLFGGEI